jgi:hypothetical protein
VLERERFTLPPRFEAAGIKVQAAQLEAYARIRDNPEAERQFAEIRLRASLLPILTAMVRQYARRLLKIGAQATTLPSCTTKPAHKRAVQTR